MITAAHTDHHYREITTLLTEEMRPETTFLTFPRGPSQARTHGQLIGNWDDTGLIAAAFTRPLYREATQLIKRNAAYHQSLSRRRTRQELTRPQKRRQGAAQDILRHIETITPHHHPDVLLAVTAHTAAYNLFAKMGYLILKPQITLVITAKLDTGIHTLGYLPGTADTCYAIKELSRTDPFSFRITHPTGIHPRTGATALWELNTNTFHQRW